LCTEFATERILKIAYIWQRYRQKLGITFFMANGVDNSSFEQWPRGWVQRKGGGNTPHKF